MVQILKELRIDSKIIDFIVRIYREDSTKIQLEKNKEIEIEVTSGIRQGCTASTCLINININSLFFIKEKTTKEIRGKIAKVVEEEWREEMEKKNSLRIYRRFKKEMKEEDYSGSLESMVWLRARTNSLNLGENSWQRNRDVCVGCSEERETLEHFILHCPRWEEWRIESRSLQRPRIEETDQVLGEFLFGGHENNTKKRTLLKMWNERQRLIRNNQENAET